MSTANAVALLLHSHDPLFTLTQIPKYPTLTANLALPTNVATAEYALKSTCAVEGMALYAWYEKDIRKIFGMRGDEDEHPANNRAWQC